MTVVGDGAKVDCAPHQGCWESGHWMHADWSLGVWWLQPDRLQSFACNMVSVKFTAEQQELETHHASLSCKRRRKKKKTVKSGTKCVLNPFAGRGGQRCAPVGLVRFTLWSRWPKCWGCSTNKSIIYILYVSIHWNLQAPHKSKQNEFFFVAQDLDFIAFINTSQTGAKGQPSQEVFTDVCVMLLLTLLTVSPISTDDEGMRLSEYAIPL